MDELIHPSGYEDLTDAQQALLSTLTPCTCLGRGYPTSTLAIGFELADGATYSFSMLGCACEVMTFYLEPIDPLRDAEGRRLWSLCEAHGLRKRDWVYNTRKQSRLPAWEDRMRAGNSRGGWRPGRVR